jgi:hypothetical protein
MATLSRNYKGLFGAWNKKRDERSEKAVKGTFVSDSNSSKKLATFVASTKTKRKVA